VGFFGRGQVVRRQPEAGSSPGDADEARSQGSTAGDAGDRHALAAKK